MLLPDQTYEGAAPAPPAPPAAPTATPLHAVLRAHRARPDFFCSYRPPPPPAPAQERPRRCSAEASREGRRARRRDRRLRDASSSNEAVHLQRRLLSLSSELVTLRNHLHVARDQPALPPRPAPPPPAPHPPPPLQPLQLPAPAHEPPKDHHHADQQQQGPQQPRSWGAPAAAPAPPAAPAPAPAPATAQPAPDVEDLVHLRGPLSEEAVVRVLQNRFYHNKFYTWIGPILVAVNGFSECGSALTLGAARAARGELARLVQDAVRHQADTGYPQAIILSGVAGSGKTHASMALLRRLFEVAGGGTETDAFKHLAAAFTVLRSLGAAHTTRNRSSSRVGHFIELQVTDGALYRTKIHCYFLEPTRVVRPLPGERNYHIFYQMLAGLTPDERARLRLDHTPPHELRYLASPHPRRPDPDDAARFQAWRTCLGVLGIPFLDVVRVLAAVLLLGNVQFAEGPDGEAEPAGESEAGAAAALLGVSPAALLRGLAARRAGSGPRAVRAVGSPAAAAAARDSLAKALYCRTVATIVRRANSLKRLGSTLGTLSSDSNESVHGGGDAASRRSAAGRGSRAAAAGSMAALNDAVRHATDGFVGILDMFGFEDAAPSRLEHLCANLCAETMQHFYNTHVFKSSAESCREEGVAAPVVEYADNVPCIDLVSSLRGGLLAALDAECAAGGGAGGSPERYAARVRQLPHARLLEPRPPHPRRFAVRHYAGDVTYDATDFLEANRDAVPADLVAAFDRRTCDFGFATHLFGAELKVLAAGGGGSMFRAAPSSAGLGAEHSSLTQDFHTRLDNLLRTLVHARPHFVRCLRANDTEAPRVFERATVAKQVRSLQVLETVTLMATGYPHRMRFRAFVARYRAVVGLRGVPGGAEGAGEEGGEACAAVLRAVEPLAPAPHHSPAAVRWAIGKRHVFLSEGMRQVLERVRRSRRAAAAACVQAAWRRHRARAPPRAAAPRARPPPAPAPALPPDPRPPPPAPQAPVPPAAEPPDKCDPALVRQTCSLFGLDLERPPPLPPSRAYSVWGGVKLGYPQTRLVSADWAEAAGAAAAAGGAQRAALRRGDVVTVVGAARPGYLAVQIGPRSVAVPHRVLAPPRAPPPPRSQPPPPAPPAAAAAPPHAPHPPHAAVA